MARLAGLEPTTSASAGLRSIQLSYKRLVPKERFELSYPFEYYALNVARLPFRHFGQSSDYIGTRLHCQRNRSAKTRFARSVAKERRQKLSAIKGRPTGARNRKTKSKKLAAAGSARAGGTAATRRAA